MNEEQAIGSDGWLLMSFLYYYHDDEFYSFEKMNSFSVK